MPTTVDVFAKVRGHEREEQLRAAREADLLPYFRLIESPALPVMEVEGRARIMLGSNNYLGLTGDERVKQGALDAVERYGTGLTGSRLLNGTTPLHLELEAEIAAWMGTEDALDRKSTRLNSSHANISYAVFCLKKKIALGKTNSDGSKFQQ